MGSRVNLDTRRPDPVELTFDGATLSAYPGETIAAALIASNINGFRRDLHGRLRGPYCNMGTCFECVLEVWAGDSWRAVRACLTPVAAGMTARSRSSVDVAGRSHG
ncbi:MAG: (2Fe-2S)-binding protein [Steroidobacteraceae bacterium]